jgi:HTH-like domain
MLLIFPYSSSLLLFFSFTRKVEGYDDPNISDTNRTGLYYQPIPPREREVAYKHRIDELYTAHPYNGSRRIAAQLHRDGWPINQKTVARYMQEMELYAGTRVTHLVPLLYEHCYF